VNDLTGKVVVVSGGSRGLGLALVQTFLQAGCRVATFSRAATPEIEQLLREDSAEARFCWERIDAADGAAIRDFALGVGRQWGGIYGLVNNAAIGIDGLLALMRQEDIHRAVAVNLTGALHLTQACARWMILGKCGAIVNVSSVNAVRGHNGVAVYSATKAALDGVTRSLAREFGPAGIRVNSVAPGYFDSDMVRGLDAAARHRIARRTPLGRLAQAADIVDAVDFLISDKARFITGQTIVVDGGITC
jgi:3-oxoacyl-[acyl-carrier protein] reductase